MAYGQEHVRAAESHDSVRYGWAHRKAVAKHVPLDKKEQKEKKPGDDLEKQAELFAAIDAAQFTAGNGDVTKTHAILARLGYKRTAHYKLDDGHIHHYRNDTRHYSLARLTEALRAGGVSGIMSGDRSILHKHFNIDVQGRDDSWEPLPTDKKQHRNQLCVSTYRTPRFIMSNRGPSIIDQAQMHSGDDLEKRAEQLAAFAATGGSDSKGSVRLSQSMIITRILDAMSKDLANRDHTTGAEMHTHHKRVARIHSYLAGVHESANIRRKERALEDAAHHRKEADKNLETAKYVGHGD